jgi:hypothetical protein
MLLPNYQETQGINLSGSVFVLWFLFRGSFYCNGFIVKADVGAQQTLFV